MVNRATDSILVQGFDSSTSKIKAPQFSMLEGIGVEARRATEIVNSQGKAGRYAILPYLADYVERTRGPDRWTLTRRLACVWTARRARGERCRKEIPKECTDKEISACRYVAGKMAGVQG